LVQAAIVVSPSSVNATATLEQTKEIRRTISIVSDGNTTTSWTASWDKDWMELDPASGGITSAYSSNSTTLTIRPEGLTEGTHSGTISIKSSNGDKTVNVTLQICPVRVIPESIQVTAPLGQTKPITRIISIVNGGQESFSWTASWDMDWMELDTLSGENNNSYSTTLTIQPEGLIEGTHSGNVTIHAWGDKIDVTKIVNVTLEIQTSVEGELGVTPLNLEFIAKKSEPPPVHSVRVFNRTNENDEFVWSAVASGWWIQLYDGHSCDRQYSSGFSPAPATSISCNSIGCQCFDISIDSERMQPGDYNGTITIYSNLKDNSTVTINVTARVVRYEIKDIEVWSSTSSWLDLQLEFQQNDLRDENGNPGNFYVLVEHPSLLPGQVYAYRCLTNPECGSTECGQKTDCRFDLFSQWGHLVPGAGSLAYQSDREWNLQEDVLTVPFGGFRLIGLEGDIIISGLTGTPKPGQDWGMTRLLKYTLHVVPLTGIWTVTDEFLGETFTYSDPLVLYEFRGQLEGAWGNARLGWWDPDNNINYVNSSDAIPGPPEIIGSRVQITDASLTAGYDIRFQEWQPLWGENLEYWYQVTDLDMCEMQGLWKWRKANETYWSVPQPFTGIRIDEDACSATQLPGQRGDVEVALHWTNYNDLDLHVIDPQGEKIYYGHRTSASGGELDVDANAGCAGHRTQNAWEHIVWVSNPPSGQYQVQVNYFAHCEGAPQENSFEVTLRIGGDETVYTGSISTVGETVDVITFEY